MFVDAYGNQSFAIFRHPEPRENETTVDRHDHFGLTANDGNREEREA